MNDTSSAPVRTLILLLASVGCGAPESMDRPDASAPRPDAGAPIVATAGVWTWVGFADTACDEGTPTGIAVNPGSSNDLLVFFNGGGACWDFDTCVRFNTSIHGPFEGPQFEAARGQLTGGFWNRGDVDNPFRDWSWVFIPYCTGDLHAGDRVTTYTSGPDARTIHHVGHANLRAFLARLAPTFPSPRRVAIAGSSAGAGGATLNYARLRAAWPDADMTLIADSLPILVGDSIAPSLRAAWRASWGLDGAVGPDPDDFSRVYVDVHAAWPNDRLAVLSTMEDFLIRLLYWLEPADFSAALVALRGGVLEPQGIRTFYGPGFGHTFWGDPAIAVNGVTVKQWVARMISRDPSWSSQPPP